MASPEPATKEHVLAVAAGKTDVGRRRDHNEDQILVSPELGLFAVADGMGGHQAGDVASSITAAALEAFFWDEPKPPIELQGFDGIANGATRLVKAVLHCNKEVFGKSGRSANEGGMGSTIVAIYLSNDEESLHIAHVGDSRCYRIRDSEIELMTQDHSMINEALRLNPDLSKEILKQLPSNVVTRALGTKENVQPDVRTEALRKGDIYLLCSDGLSGEISDEDMLFGVLESEDLEDACDLLVAMANEAGGRDNISAVLVRVERDSTKPVDQPLAAVSGEGDDLDIDVDISGEETPDAGDDELDAWLAEPESDKPSRPRRPAVPRPGAKRPKPTADQVITRPMMRRPASLDAKAPGAAEGSAAAVEGATPATPSAAGAAALPAAGSKPGVAAKLPPAAKPPTASQPAVSKPAAPPPAASKPGASKPPGAKALPSVPLPGTKRPPSKPPAPLVKPAATSRPILSDEPDDAELDQELDQELGKPLDHVELADDSLRITVPLLETDSGETEHGEIEMGAGEIAEAEAAEAELAEFEADEAQAGEPAPARAAAAKAAVAKAAVAKAEPGEAEPGDTDAGDTEIGDAKAGHTNARDAQGGKKPAGGASIFDTPLSTDVEALTALEPPFGNEPARLRRHFSEPPESLPEPPPPLPTFPIAGVPVLSVGEPLQEPEHAAVVRLGRCEHCGHKLLPEERFCGMCGTRVRERTMDPSIPRCDACGTEVLEDTRFCIECGVRLESGDPG